MRGGQRQCVKCIHGPLDTCAMADVREWYTTDYGARFCSEMKCEPITSRAISVTKRFASEWPERKAVKR